jgi:hypothetical protein
MVRVNSNSLYPKTGPADKKLASSASRETDDKKRAAGWRISCLFVFIAVSPVNRVDSIPFTRSYHILAAPVSHSGNIASHR